MTSTPSRCSSIATSLPSSPEPSSSTRVAEGDSGVPSTTEVIGNPVGARKRALLKGAIVNGSSTGAFGILGFFPTHPMRRTALACLALALSAAGNAGAVHWSPPEYAGLLADPELAEVSGLA